MQVKIGDFGLACLDTIDKENTINLNKSPDDDTSDDSPENRTKGVGTLVYASPEQINGQTNYDTKVEYYYFGDFLIKIWY